MKARLTRIRAAIIASFVVLGVLLAVMVSSLLERLQDLATAAGDTTLWSVAQLDTEFGNLEIALAERLLDPAATDNDVRLRANIALGRVEIVNGGSSRALLENSDGTIVLLQPFDDFADTIIPLIDRPQPLSQSDLRQMLDMVRALRPNARTLALRAVSESARWTKARRADFAWQLTLTGGTAIGLIVLMVALLVVLDRLLQRAARRDAQLFASSENLTSTLAASLDGIITSDHNGRVTGFNAAAEAMLGWKKDDILGRLMEDTFIPHRIRAAHASGMTRFLTTGEQRVVDRGRVEMTALCKSGKEIPVEINITSTDKQDDMKFIAYMRDISERKASEEKLIEARNRAEQADRAKSRFLTVMSHEMRTPLNGILGVLDLLKTTPLSPRQKRYTQVASASGEILLEHVNEALDITRIENGTLALSMGGFDLPALVGSVADVLDPLAREKGLRLSVSIDDTVAQRFVGDANRIRQILTNLVGNAIKFTDAGHITLSAQAIQHDDAPFVSFSVTDTGAGIAEALQEQVFEDFVALTNAEDMRQRRSDGLGLSISRRIARQMGGDVTLLSALGEGSCFTLRVPMQQDLAPRAPVPSVRDASEYPVPARRILVVEDNAVNRTVLRDMLEGMGHTVQEAVNGAEALARAETQPFDIVFMDISMPVMDGIDATRQLRSGQGPNRATQIVGLTAHGREEYRDAAEQAGMDRFHTKPIRLAALNGILADISGRDPVSPVATTEPDALRELFDSLGGPALDTALDRFFDECTAFLDRAAKPSTDLADTAHQLKGAAAMFGLSDLAARFEAMEPDLRAGSGAAVRHHAKQLKDAAKTTRRSARRAIAQF